jgi:hypothetical protein
MESIPYRKSKILIKTIPKGTLLFRLTGYPKNDLRGVPKKDGTRCILSNHNVFFYPNPFVGNIALYKFKDTDLKHLAIFVLKNDIKVIWLLNPSKYSRVTKNTKRNFLKKCSTVRQGCLDRKIISRGLHANYNPCLSDTIIKKYPDVVGMLTNAVGDNKRILEGYPALDKKKKQYFNFATDAIGVTSIPELILHPLKERPSKDLIVEKGDKLEVNYKLIAEYDVSEQDKILKFMEKHTEYNPETYFFNYKE